MSNKAKKRYKVIDFPGLKRKDQIINYLVENHDEIEGIVVAYIDKKETTYTWYSEGLDLHATVYMLERLKYKLIKDDDE